MSSYSVVSTQFICRLKKDANHNFIKPNHVHVYKTLPRQAIHASFNILRSLSSSSNGDCLLVPSATFRSSAQVDEGDGQALEAVPSATFRSSAQVEEGDGQALEAVLKLYSAIKQRNLREISNVIGDECRCVCNFIPSFHPSQGKKQVLELFAYLMRYMGQNVEFLVQPTVRDGMTVSVKWRLVWDKTHMPLGEGISFYVCHTYNGKVVIKHMEMIMEPLLQIEPLRLKMTALVMPILEKIGSNSIIKSHGERIKFVLLSAVIIVALFLVSKLFLP